MLSNALLLSLLAGSPTWSADIGPLVHQHCSECHRPGEAAPFSLLTYEDTQKRAKMLRLVMEDGYMPPWHPVEGHGKFVGERHLSDEELALFAAWVEADCPKGGEGPEPPTFGSEWSLGEPDLVLEMADAYPVIAAGPDIYRNFCLETGLDEERWITAIEVRPSARSVVHHVLFFSDTKGVARRAEAADPTPGFDGMALGVGGGNSLGGWAVGAGAFQLREGLSMHLPKGADIVLQTHFHPSGKAEDEKTRIGVYFAEKAPEKEIVTLQLPPEYSIFHGLEIQPGDDDFRMRDSFEVPVDTELHSVGGHAHYLGKELRGWAVLPDGTEKPLFYIDEWDFNWQGRYQYEEPVLLPAGTTVEVELAYDNSETNPANPNSPPKRVTWGLQSYDEMGAVTWITTPAKAEDQRTLSRAVRAKRRHARDNRKEVTIDWHARVLALDLDQDGKISGDEMPEAFKRALKRLDLNDDGTIDEKELAALKIMQRFGR